MKILLKHGGKKYEADLANPHSIAIPLRPNKLNPNCFYAPPCTASPVRTDSFTGSVAEGGLLNFYNVRINPHGNGTHTESVGHLLESMISIDEVLTRYHFIAQLISVYPEMIENGDRVITSKSLRALEDVGAECLIIRTLPNSEDKLTRNYSGTNPAYLDPDLSKWIRNRNYEHLLVDIPSVDREDDEGKLESHKSFWKTLDDENKRTISELIFVPNHVTDGIYLLNLQVPALLMDAAPSRPVLYKLVENK
jgi:kynurenine formamidase